jgi:hypothetical protein
MLKSLFSPRLSRGTVYLSGLRSLGTFGLLPRTGLPKECAITTSSIIAGSAVSPIAGLHGDAQQGRESWNGFSWSGRRRHSY